MSVIQGKGVVVRHAGGKPTVEDILVDDPGPGEVRVKIQASGVCHTDLHTLQGNFGTAFPYLLGHEATGIVESVGEGVTRPAVGDTVTLAWRSPCGACPLCTRGEPQFCPNATVTRPRVRLKDGTLLGRVLSLGAFATHTVVSAAQAIPMKPSLDPACTCLIGCAVGTGVGSVLNVAEVPAGSTVAVFGCGAVGVSVIQGAKLAHASKIIGVDLSPQKLQWAKLFGATDLVDASVGDPVAKIRELTGGRGVDFAFEAVGVPKVVEQAVASCGIAGSAIAIGVPSPGTEIRLPLDKFFFARGRLRATSYGDIMPSRDFPLFSSLYEKGDLQLDDFVTRRISLGDVPEAFAAMERGETLRSVILFD